MPVIVDLTHPITATMPVHACDEPVAFSQIRILERDHYNDWRLCSGMHVGTHIDGPGHLTDSPLRMHEVPVTTFVGKGFLVDARTQQLDVALLHDLPDEEGLIVLILMGMATKFGTNEYFEQHPVMSLAFAQELIRRKVKMVGIDFFSPDKYPFEVHKFLARHGIFIIENLTNVEQLIGKNFTIIALPLKIDADSAPARVIALIE